MREAAGAYVSAFDRLEETLAGREVPRIGGRIVVYGGKDSQERSKDRLLSWRDLDRHGWL